MTEEKKAPDTAPQEEGEVPAQVHCEDLMRAGSASSVGLWEM